MQPLCDNDSRNDIKKQQFSWLLKNSFEIYIEYGEIYRVRLFLQE